MRFAAGGNTGAAIANYLNKDGVDYSKLGARQIRSQAEEFADTINSNFMVGGVDLDAAARIQATEHWTDAGGEIAQNQANTNIWQSTIEGVGQIGSSAIKRYNKGWKDASDIDFPGNQVDPNGRLRY